MKVSFPAKGSVRQRLSNLISELHDLERDLKQAVDYRMDNDDDFYEKASSDDKSLMCVILNARSELIEAYDYLCFCSLE